MKNVSSNVSSNRTFYISFVLFILGLISNPLASEFIFKLFPERPLLPDLFFMLTPPMGWLQYASDPLMIVSFVIFLWGMKKKLSKDIFSKIFMSFAIAHFLRAILMILTPMGRHLTNNQPYGITRVTQHGLFPSGHTAAAFLLILLIPKNKNRLKQTLSILFGLQIIVLILSRGHYSIDIVGGVGVAYFSYEWTKKLLKRLPTK